MCLLDYELKSLQKASISSQVVAFARMKQVQDEVEALLDCFPELVKLDRYERRALSRRRRAIRNFNADWMLTAME
jgi:hypothetical protein